MAAAHRKHEPGEGKAADNDGRRDDRGRRAEEVVRDEEHGGSHRDREHSESRNRQPIRGVHDVRLRPELEVQTVDHRRRDQQDRCEQREQQRAQVQRSLETAHRAEALVEGCDEQEREQHLNARQRHAQLPEQLVQVAVVALELRLVAKRRKPQSVARARFRAGRVELWGRCLSRCRHLGGVRVANFGGGRMARTCDLPQRLTYPARLRSSAATPSVPTS